MFLCGRHGHGFESHFPPLSTINQLIRKPRRIKKILNNSVLKGNPLVKGICLKVVIQKPKKPNSAERKIARVKLRTGRVLTAYIPGQGHNLQKFSVVLIRGGRANDVPACRYN